jgi:hypothetical protein
MPVLTCHVDERSYAALEAYSRASGRPVVDLAEAAISEAAMSSERILGRVVTQGSHTSSRPNRSSSEP